MKIDDFVLEHVFHHIPATKTRDQMWWRETVDIDGYIMFWEDGTSHHTYHYPPDWYKE